MADAANFMHVYSAQIANFVNLLGDLEIMNQQLVDDPSLITRYFQLSNARTDITATDVSNAQSAIVQMLFTFTSGSPTQQSFLHKMMP